MNEAVFRISNIAVYGFGLLTVFSFLWGSFVFYKKAVESHLEEFQVLDAIVLMAFWGFIGGRLGYVFSDLTTFWNHFSRIFLIANYPGIDRWGAIFGMVLGLLFVVRRTKSKYFDWSDLMSLGIVSGASIFSFGLLFLSYMWQFIVIGLFFLLAFLLFWGMEEKYRTFEWYKGKRTSAKSGLISGLSIVVFGVVYVIEIILFRHINWQSVLWGVVLFVSGLTLVYIRSGRTVVEDIKIILKHGKK